jgi:hypothetical protein
MQMLARYTHLQSRRLADKLDGIVAPQISAPAPGARGQEDILRDIEQMDPRTQAQLLERIIESLRR